MYLVSKKGWMICGIAMASFAAGALVSARLSEVSEARAESSRVFELRIYHAVPGKAPALESRFRDTASKLLARHQLNAVGYWLPEEAAGFENTFIYLVAHLSRDDAKKNWAAMAADPEFKEMMKSEQREKLVEKVDSVYMRPSDFSPMK